MLLDNIALFLKIVECGGLAAAGREVGLSPASVSEKLAALETHYGVVLLHRTTRAISLTEEGRVLLKGAKTLLDDVADLETRIKFGAQALRGPIKISAPSDLGRTLISAAVADFLEEHPDIKIELFLSDGYVDIVAEGIDIALRFGRVSDSTLRVKSLGAIKRVLCASPSYVQRHPPLTTPTELTQHNCLVMRFGQHLDNAWCFEREVTENKEAERGEVERGEVERGETERARKQVIHVEGDRIANDGALARQWCLEGYGIMLKSELDVRADLAAGRLLELLAEYAPPATPLQMMYPPARAQPRRVRALADHLIRYFEAYN